MRQAGFTLMELMIVVAIIGILAATGMAMYSSYMLRSKSSEAPRMLEKIVSGQIQFYARETNFLETGPTNIPPSAAKTLVDFSADPSWSQIAFSINDPIFFGYQSVSPAAMTIDCEAMGDLDGDGTLSTFRRSIDASSGTVQVGGVQIFDELE